MTRTERASEETAISTCFANFVARENLDHMLLMPDTARQMIQEAFNEGWKASTLEPRDAECAPLEAENKRLREGLEAAKELIADWGSYAPWYFQEKHNLAGDLARISNILNGDKENKLMNKCKCGHYWSAHRDRDYDADVAGSIPGQGSCTECDCSNFRPAPTEEQ